MANRHVRDPFSKLQSTEKRITQLIRTIPSFDGYVYTSIHTYVCIWPNHIRSSRQLPRFSPTLSKTPKREQCTANDATRPLSLHDVVYFYVLGYLIIAQSMIVSTPTCVFRSVSAAIQRTGESSRFVQVNGCYTSLDASFEFY